MGPGSEAPPAPLQSSAACWETLPDTSRRRDSYLHVLQTVLQNARQAQRLLYDKQTERGTAARPHSLFRLCNIFHCV